MTDSTIKKKSQHFRGEAETVAMLDILREIDTIKFFGKLGNGEIIATFSTVVLLLLLLLLLLDLQFQLKSRENIGRMTRGGRASRESLIRLCSVTYKQEYDWNIL